MNPKETLIAYLCHPSEFRKVSFSERNTNVNEAIIQILKEHEILPFWLCLVAYETIAGEQWQETCLFEQNKEGVWNFKEGVGSLESDKVRNIGLRNQSVGNRAWVQLSGGGAEPFWASGRVITNGYEVVSIRLISEDRHILEDSVQQGNVLFLTNQSMQRPIAVELYTHFGNLIGQQMWQEGKKEKL